MNRRNPTIVLMVIVASLIFLTFSNNTHASSIGPFFGSYNITSQGLTVISNHSYFVSKPYAPDSSNKTILFHNVIFMLPFGSLSNPGGFDTVMISFLDGVNETLGAAHRGPAITVFSNHTNPQAGFSIQPNGTLNLLVSNPTKNATVILDPLKQFKSGIVSNKVSCKEGLQLILKAEDGSPACVKPDTSNILIERGWAKPV